MEAVKQCKGSVQRRVHCSAMQEWSVRSWWDFRSFAHVDYRQWGPRLWGLRQRGLYQWGPRWGYVKRSRVSVWSFASLPLVTFNWLLPIKRQIGIVVVSFQSRSRFRNTSVTTQHLCPQRLLFYKKNIYHTLSGK